MKHEHSDINVNVDFVKEDVEDVIDKITESVVVIILVATATQAFKKLIGE